MRYNFLILFLFFVVFDVQAISSKQLREKLESKKIMFGITVAALTIAGFLYYLWNRKLEAIKLQNYKEEKRKVKESEEKKEKEKAEKYQKEQQKLVKIFLELYSSQQKTIGHIVKMRKNMENISHYIDNVIDNMNKNFNFNHILSNLDSQGIKKIKQAMDIIREAEENRKTLFQRWTKLLNQEETRLKNITHWEPARIINSSIDMLLQHLSLFKYTINKHGDYLLEKIFKKTTEKAIYTLFELDSEHGRVIELDLYQARGDFFYFSGKDMFEKLNNPEKNIWHFGGPQCIIPMGFYKHDPNCTLLMFDTNEK